LRIASSKPRLPVRIPACAGMTEQQNVLADWV